MLLFVSPLFLDWLVVWVLRSSLSHFPGRRPHTQLCTTRLHSLHLGARYPRNVALPLAKVSHGLTLWPVKLILSRCNTQTHCFVFLLHFTARPKYQQKTEVGVHPVSLQDALCSALNIVCFPLTSHEYACGPCMWPCTPFSLFFFSLCVTGGVCRHLPGCTETRGSHQRGGPVHCVLWPQIFLRCSWKVVGWGSVLYS